MTDKSEPMVLVDIDDRGVASVTLNRPKVNNAYNAEFVSALGDAFLSLQDTQGLRMVVVRGIPASWYP